MHAIPDQVQVLSLAIVGRSADTSDTIPQVNEGSASDSDTKFDGHRIH